MLDVNGRIYLARRKGGPSAGLWELPGGKAERGETDEAALAREIAEELGVAVLRAEELSRTRAKVGSRRFEFVIFRTETDAPPADSSAHDLFGWFSPVETVALPLAPLDVPVLPGLVSRLLGRGDDDPGEPLHPGLS